MQWRRAAAVVAWWCSPACDAARRLLGHNITTADWPICVLRVIMPQNLSGVRLDSATGERGRQLRDRTQTRRFSCKSAAQRRTPRKRSSMH